jgi:hypothetical protein
MPKYPWAFLEHEITHSTILATYSIKETCVNDTTMRPTANISVSQMKTLKV